MGEKIQPQSVRTLDLAGVDLREASAVLGQVGGAGPLREDRRGMLTQMSSGHHLLFGGQRDNFAAAISLAICGTNRPWPSRRLSCSANDAQKSLNLCFRTPFLPGSPHRTGASSRCTGRQEVITRRAGVPPSLPNHASCSHG